MKYRAFGIVMESDIPLPELLPAEGESSWRILDAAAVDGTFERYHTIESTPGTPWMHLARNGERYLVEHMDFGSFVVRPDRTIEVIASGAPAETLRHLLVDQVLPMALAHHGDLVLHAAGVEWEGKAVAFIGRTGAGKSTLAAACVDRGAALVTDDALVLRGTAGSPMASVSYGGIRLWGDSGARYDSAAEPTYVAHYSDKRRVTMRASDDSEIPVAAIFALESGDGVTVEEIAARDALMLLLGNTYRLDPFEPAALRREFLALQQLASAFPIRRLRYPHRYEALDEVIGVLRGYCR